MSTQQMRAVQAVKPGEAFVVTQIAVPDPGPGQVRVKVSACGVCAGETVVRLGLLGAQLPRVPGHEIAGVIDTVGPGVKAWKPGDRVGVGWQGGYCSECEFCRQGDFVNCIDSKVVGLSYDGGYAEYMVARQEALARIPDTLSFEEAGPLMCAGITTFNALRHSGARAGDTVAIHGIGGLGHLGVQFASRMGFRTVAINRDRKKEDLARRLGADDYINSNEGSAGEALKRLGGAAVVLSTVGSSSAQVDLIQGLRPNGRLILVAADHQPLQFPADRLLFGRRTVTGWYSGHAKDSEETMAFAALKGVRPMVETHPLEEAESTFQNMNKAQFRAVLYTLMEQRISLVTLGVFDLDRSRMFYERLGWRRSLPDTAGIVFFQAGGMALALYPRAELANDAQVSAAGHGFGGMTLAYNARSRAEVDSVLAEAQAAGAKVLKRAQDAFWGGYSGYFSDPDGFLWEIAWNPSFPIAEDGSTRLPE